MKKNSPTNQASQKHEETKGTALSPQKFVSMNYTLTVDEKITQFNQLGF